MHAYDASSINAVSLFSSLKRGTEGSLWILTDRSKTSNYKITTIAAGQLLLTKISIAKTISHNSIEAHCYDESMHEIIDY